MRRYARHISLKEIGETGQRKLKSSSALVVGIGALGNVSSLYLTAAGIGKLGLIDNDKISLHNLQRQIIYSKEDIGKFKTETAKKKLLSINQNILIHAYSFKLTEENAEKIIKDYDIVIDGTDNIDARQAINKACVKLNKPFIFGGILGFEGQTSVFHAKRGPCYRCVFKNLSCNTRIDTCARVGVLNIIPGVIGSIQASEAIKLIVGKGKSLVGKLLTFNALQTAFSELNIKKNKNCPVCGIAIL